MASHVDYHILPGRNGWALKRTGAARATRRFRSKQEALEHGRRLCLRNNGSLRIHGLDGRIHEERTYRDDPSRTPG